MSLRLLALLLGLASPLCGQRIETAYTRYYEADQIRSIGDYFGDASPRQGFRTLVMTDTTNPAGHYFILHLEGDFPANGTLLEIQVLRSDRKTIETIRHALEAPLESPWLYFGLTGKDWPAASVEPVAWCIHIKDRDDRPIAVWKSFLWEKP